MVGIVARIIRVGPNIVCGAHCFPVPFASTDNEIGDAGAVSLVEALIGNDTLTQIDLRRMLYAPLALISFNNVRPHEGEVWGGLVSGRFRTSY